MFGKTPSESENLPIRYAIGRGGKAVVIDKRFRKKKKIIPLQYFVNDFAVVLRTPH